MTDKKPKQKKFDSSKLADILFNRQNGSKGHGQIRRERQKELDKWRKS